MITVKTDFVWANNKVKLELAIRDLIEQKKSLPNLVIDEQSVKERYELRGGLVLTQEEIESVDVVVKQKPVVRRNVIRKAR